MKILMITDNDPAGMGIAFCNAINRYSAHSCRLITKEIRYNFMFEKDIHLPWLDKDGWAEVEELLRTSDAFHFHMTSDEYTEIGPFRPVDYIKGKVVIHHHHGHPDFRGNPEKYRQKYRERGRRNLLVSTPDLLKLLPEASWQPNLVPIESPLYTPLSNKPEDPVIICHSPTKKYLKNTKQLIEALTEVKSTLTIPFEFRLIENMSHKECLQLKRESHILFDHLQGYYGVSSLEGLSQGLCVVAGIDDWNRRHLETFTGTTQLPWIIMTLYEMAGLFQSLITDKPMLKSHSDFSRKFMENYWTEERVLQPLIDEYTQ